MILTRSTLIGLLEAEGSFSISIRTDKKGYFRIQFECSLLTQKDEQLMNACVGFLSTLTQTDRRRIRSNLIYIYYSSHMATYRKFTMESILKKFQVI